MVEDTAQTVSERLGAMWCGLMHHAMMWPIHGQYQCGICGRHYPVQWAGAQTPRIHQGQSRSFSATLPLLLVVALLVPLQMRAAKPSPDTPTEQAAMAFARYLAGPAQANIWNVEGVDVEASLPGRKTQGHLRAIRRLLMGKPQYQVLEIAGDKTVRQQVILRYLSAEIEGAALPASAVAITPANYRFHYNGPVQISGTTAYSFSIKPRSRREGLIRGELSIDGETGTVIRETGYLVKSPSLFVKRVTVDRMSGLLHGLVQERVTHISVETRLIGRAELTIDERPWSDADDCGMPGCQQR